MTTRKQSKVEPATRENLLGWLKRISADPIYVGIASAIVGALVGLAIPWAAHQLFGPPPDRIVLRIMDQEVQFAKNHRGDQAVKLYAPNAVVVDAGCQTPGVGTVYRGADAIRQRYEALPSFANLSHVNAQISWIPSNNSATRATATAETVGVISPATPIRGYEQWEFALFAGKWLITSFTYNLCFPSTSPTSSLPAPGPAQLTHGLASAPLGDWQNVNTIQT